MIQVQLVGADGTRLARLTDEGVLAVGAAEYDLAEFHTLGVDDQGYSFYEPRAGKRFVMTGLLVFGDRDISDADDTIVTIYESDAPDSAVVARTLFQFGVARLSVLPLVPLNIAVNPGVWVTASTSDDDVHMTILGHYVAAL